jgi:hypothetical protein
MQSGGYDTFDVINGNCIDWSSHTCSRLDDGSEGSGILRERMTKLEEFSLLGHPNPPRSTHGVFQFSLPLNKAQGFVQRFHQISV